MVKWIYMVFCLSMYGLGSVVAATGAMQSIAAAEGILFLAVFLYINRRKNHAKREA